MKGSEPPKVPNPKQLTPKWRSFSLGVESERQQTFFFGRGGLWNSLKGPVLRCGTTWNDCRLVVCFSSFLQIRSDWRAENICPGHPADAAHVTSFRAGTPCHRSWPMSLTAGKQICRSPSPRASRTPRCPRAEAVLRIVASWPGGVRLRMDVA